MAVRYNRAVIRSGCDATTTFTEDQLRQEPEVVLNAARTQGEVRIITRDGREYAVRPIASTVSPFDIPGVNLGFRADEIVAFIREDRGQ